MDLLGMCFSAIAKVIYTYWKVFFSQYQFVDFIFHFYVLANYSLMIWFEAENKKIGFETGINLITLLLKNSFSDALAPGQRFDLWMPVHVLYNTCLSHVYLLPCNIVNPKRLIVQE